MFKKLTFPLIVCTIACLMLVGQAQSQEKQMRIAFVDMQSVLKNTPTIKDQVEAHEREMRNLQNEIEGLSLQLDRRIADFNQKRAVLSESASVTMRTEITDLQKMIDGKQQEVDAMIADLKAKFIDPFLVDIRSIALDLAKVEGYDMILHSDVLLFGAEQHNLTEKVTVAMEKMIQDKLAAEKASIVDKEADKQKQAIVDDQKSKKRP